MALFKCPECGNDVSTEAAACPKCGYPIKENLSTLLHKEDENAKDSTALSQKPDMKELAEELVRKSSDNASQTTEKKQTHSKASSGSGHGCLTVFLILLAIAGLVLVFGQCGGSSSGKSDSWNNEISAKTYAEFMVKDNLKAPSTAKFCNSATEMNAKNLGGSKWKVTGWVDAQNSFGAMIRSDFEVTLELTETGAKRIDVKITARK